MIVGEFVRPAPLTGWRQRLEVWEQEYKGEPMWWYSIAYFDEEWVTWCTGVTHAEAHALEDGLSELNHRGYVNVNELTPR